MFKFIARCLIWAFVLIALSAMAPGGDEISQVFAKEMTAKEMTANQAQKVQNCNLPNTGTWTIEQDCTIQSDRTAPGNVTVRDGVTLRIASNAALYIDFVDHALRVQAGGRIEIQAGGKISTNMGIINPPDSPNSPDSHPIPNIPDYVGLSDDRWIIVDFRSNANKLITLPEKLLSEFPTYDGEYLVPDNFCGLRIFGASQFVWFHPNGGIVGQDTGSLEEAFYNYVPEESSVLEMFGMEYYSRSGLGIEFTGPIGPCSESPGNFHFPYPLTDNGKNLLPNLQLVIDVADSDAEIEFLNYNFSPHLLSADEIFKEDSWEKIFDIILAQLNGDVEKRLENFDEFVNKVCLAAPDKCPYAPSQPLTIEEESPGLSNPQEPTDEPIQNTTQMGDVNCDDSINSIDALFVLQRDLGQRQDSDQCESAREPGMLYLPACDVNSDGECGSVDALFILQCDIGRANPLCPDDAVVSSQVSRITEGNATLRIETADTTSELTQGDTFMATVIADSDVEVGAVTASIRYDSAQFKAVSCQIGFDMGGCNPTYGADSVRFNVAMPSGLSGSLHLADITFERIGNEEASAFELEAHTFADIAGGALSMMAEVAPINSAVSSPYSLYLPLMKR